MRLWYSCASEVDEKGLGRFCEECDLRYQACANIQYF